MAFTTEMLGDPAAPSSALWGDFCSHICVLNTVRHTGTFSNRRPARPLAERLYIDSPWLTFLFISHPGSIRLCPGGQVQPEDIPKSATERRPRAEPGALARASLIFWPQGSSRRGKLLTPLLSLRFSFHPGVGEITGPKAPPGAGRISTSFAFVNLLGLARTSQQDVLRVKQRFA